MKRHYLSASFCVALLCLVSCQEKPEEQPDDGGGHAYKSEFVWDDPVDIFGFQPEARYAYCPSAIEMPDGSCHVFFCGNPQAGKMVDNVYHLFVKADGSMTEAVSVLQPTPGTWDSFHCCDPSVIEGNFRLDGKAYKYAMFYLGIDKGDCLGNEVGVAFSNDLNSTSWVKYPSQLIPFDGDRSRYWGVGQPSALSLDGKGKVLLTYTVGDGNGTRVVYNELDMSDMSQLLVGERKTVPTGGSSIVFHNCDFAFDRDAGRIVATIAGDWPSNYPSFIESFTAVASMDLDSFYDNSGSWKRLKDINYSVSGYNRNHNACLLRDSFGYVKDYKTPTVFFTISGTVPTAEWSYRIMRTDGRIIKVEVTD